MSDDYTKDYIEDMARDLGGKQPGEVVKDLKKHMMIKEYIDRATEGMKGNQRNDVARELKSHILDSADALAAERKVPVDDVIVKDVLDKMGPADMIAAMYPTKKTILEHGMGKALLSLAGLALSFLAVAAILWLFAPDTLKMTVPGSGPTQNVIQVILSVVFSLALAIVVIACIFLCMYLYKTMVKTPYEARLKAFERSLHNVASPIAAAGKIIGVSIWLILVNLFWYRVQFITSFGDNTVLVPLLSDKFGPFLLYINLIGIAGIIIALLYLILAQKWIPSLLDALLNLSNALLFIWIITVFPFNIALSTGVVTFIKVILAVAILGCLTATAKKVWDTIKFALQGKIGNNDTA